MNTTIVLSITFSYAVIIPIVLLMVNDNKTYSRAAKRQNCSFFHKVMKFGV